MANRLVWSEQAVSDLQAIAQYISRDSPRYASSVVRRIVEAASLLSKFPKMGRVVPEFGSPNIHELQAVGYRIIYTQRADQIIVVAVIHARRELT